MNIIDMLDNAKSGLSDLKRKYRFNKANKSRTDAAEFLSSIAKCRGQLEICSKEFNQIIRDQTRNIEAGKKQHADTIHQEQMLWDAAIGYMLVKDAIYEVKTINSNDSISHAYDMLDAAVDQMKGKKNKLLDVPHLKPLKKRNVYGYITSDIALQEKKSLLDSFFEKLKKTGDIEACLQEAYDKQKTAASRSSGGTDYEERLNRMPENKGKMNAEELNSLKDFKAPNQ